MGKALDDVITVNASELRRKLFYLLDLCLETGTEIEVLHRRRTLRIVAPVRRIKVGELPRRPGAVVDGDDLDRFSPAEWRSGE